MTSFEKYAVLDAQINVLTTQRDALKPEIIEEIIAKGAKSTNTAVGKFTVKQLKTWTYSSMFEKKEKKIKSEIKDLKEEVKALQAKEQEDEIATYVANPSLVFTEIKL